MELTYHWEGDVLIPDLELEDGSNYQIGKYGRMRQRYLFENHHAMYTHLVLTEKLWKHLEEVDMECNDMMDMLTVRMAEREGVTEHLKSVDQLGWVRKMNNIRIAGNLNWFPAVWHMKKFIENSVDSVKFLAYNDIEAESLLRNLRSVMHNTKGGMPT